MPARSRRDHKNRAESGLPRWSTATGERGLTLQQTELGDLGRNPPRLIAREQDEVRHPPLECLCTGRHARDSRGRWQQTAVRSTVSNAAPELSQRRLTESALSQ